MISTQRIRTLGDPVLIKPTEPIIAFDNDNINALADLADIMFDVMYDSHGVGLAANQIGISKSIFVYDDHEGHKGIVCNPRYDALMECRETTTDEGCLSVPGIHRNVTRYTQVILQGQTIYGEEVTYVEEGWLARIFQHETDHLDGKLYISYLSKGEQMAIVLANQVI